MREKTTRPQASEAVIRDMHAKAYAAGQRAAQHDTNAVRIVGEAEAGAEQMRRDAARRHEDRLAHAHKMAADNIAAAEAEAARIVADAKRLAEQHIAQQQADADDERQRTEAMAEENLLKAHKVAHEERDKQAAEQRDRDYWTSLASREAAAANLSTVPPTSPMDTVPEGEVAQP